MRKANNPMSPNGGIRPRILAAIFLGVAIVGGIAALESGGGQQTNGQAKAYSQEAQAYSEEQAHVQAQAFSQALAYSQVDTDSQAQEVLQAAEADASPYTPPGENGVIYETTTACPDKDDLTTFSFSYHQASIANDDVGKQNAITTAAAAYCITFVPGDTVLVIATSGNFPDDYDEVRMDSDPTAYWIATESILAIPGQPNKSP